MKKLIKVYTRELIETNPYIKSLVFKIATVISLYVCFMKKLMKVYIRELIKTFLLTIYVLVPQYPLHVLYDHTEHKDSN